MPYKHQEASYRTRKGIRYECDGDVLDCALGDLRQQARDRVNYLRQRGQPAFFESMDGGTFYRVFVAQDECQHTITPANSGQPRSQS